MRLDMYLPRTGGGPAPGPMRRLLAHLGPTWAAAPVRRIIQSASLLLFLLLFLWVCWPYGSEQDYARSMQARERIGAETFLMLDPLAGLCAALASRIWVGALVWAGGMLAVCLLVPRGFCGYVCPLGSLIDLFDWVVGRHARRLHVQRGGWWANLKYYLLAGTLLASALGVVACGFVAAIPVLTRGLLFTLAPVQMGMVKGWYLVPPMNAGHYLSIALFLAVFAVGLLGQRFWCRCVCPTGAVFSIASVLRLTERKVEATCTSCGQCRRICSFGAIRPDFTTRTSECTQCQTCGGVCPTGSIQFVGRWDRRNLKTADEATGTAGIPLSRRGFLAAAVGGVGLAVGARHPSAADRLAPLVRPPGSVPEEQFLQLCIRCGECFKACPNNVLQPVGLERGWEDLWTPKVTADWSGCEPSCNNCGQVCPTGAIRALPLAEKRAARMGLAVVNEQTCLPHAGRGDCRMCVDECAAAGYAAIEFRRVGVQLDGDGEPIEESGRLAPVVLPEACVGCGLCQARCHNINVKQKRLLGQTAILIVPGAGLEDRLRSGSYLALHKLRQQTQDATPASMPASAPTGGDDYLPEFLR